MFSRLVCPSPPATSRQNSQHVAQVLSQMNALGFISSPDVLCRGIMWAKSSQRKNRYFENSFGELAQPTSTCQKYTPSSKQSVMSHEVRGGQIPPPLLRLKVLRQHNVYLLCHAAQFSWQWWQWHGSVHSQRIPALERTKKVHRNPIPWERWSIQLNPKRRISAV